MDRRRASGEQFATLLEFMESHGDLAKVQPSLQGRLKAECLWQEVANTLNSINGVRKAPKQWKKVWSDWKNKTKTKAERASGGPNSRKSLNSIEQRLLTLISPVATEDKSSLEEEGRQGVSKTSQPLAEKPAPPLMTPKPLFNGVDVNTSNTTPTDDGYIEGEGARKLEAFSGNVLARTQELRSGLYTPSKPAATGNWQQFQTMSVFGQSSEVHPGQPPAPSKASSSIGGDAQRSPPMQSHNSSRRFRIRERLRHVPNSAPETADNFMPAEERRFRMEVIRERWRHEREIARIKINQERNVIFRSLLEVMQRFQDVLEGMVPDSYA